MHIKSLRTYRISMLQWCHCKSFLPQFCVKHAFPCSQSEFTCLQLGSHCLPFHWASEIPGVLSSSGTAPTVLADAARSQPAFPAIWGHSALLYVSSSSKSCTKATEAYRKKFNGTKICSTNILGAEPNARFIVQNFYVRSISFFCSRAFSIWMIVCPWWSQKCPVKCRHWVNSAGVAMDGRMQGIARCPRYLSKRWVEECGVPVITNSVHLSEGKKCSLPE